VGNDSRPTGSIHPAQVASVQAVAVSTDGRRAVSGGDDGMVRVWDLDVEELRTVTGHDGPVGAVAVGADGRCAVSAGGGMVRMWNLDAGTLLHTLTVGTRRQWRSARTAAARSPAPAGCGGSRT
jgi:WD40 repeat protein